MSKYLAVTALLFLILGNYFTQAESDSPSIPGQLNPVLLDDAGVITIAPLPGGNCQGTYPIRVQIKNYGQANLTQAQIDWQVNGISQTPFNWVGNLAMDSVSPLFTIDSFPFGGGSFDIKAYTTIANSQNEINHANDTSGVIYNFPNMGGVYTMGGSQPDFVDLNSFFLSLKNNGMCGPVILNIRNGIYASTSLPVNFIPGSSLTNTITIQSESGDSTRVFIGKLSSYPAFEFYGADFITLKQVTLAKAFGSGDAVVWNNGSEHCSLVNCIVNGKIQVLNNCHHILIANNTVYDHIMLNPHSSNEEFGNTILNNTIFSDFGISCYFQDSLRIEKNIIANLNPFWTQANHAIKLLNWGSSFTCVKNRIRGNFDIGLYITQDGDTGSPGIIANNIVTTGPAGGVAAYLHCSEVLFVYNTLFAPDYGIPIINESAPFDQGLIVMNNQFINYGYNLASAWEEIDFSTHTFSDYNNYFTGGMYPIQVGTNIFNSVSAFNAAHPGFDDHSTNTNPGFQTNSYLFPFYAYSLGTGTPVPLVTDDFNNALRDTLFPTMGAMEVPPVVIHDSLTKDIITTLLNDTVELGSNTISIRIKNQAPFTADSSLYLYEGVIDTIYLSYSVNGDSTVHETWTGSLALNDSITFNFPATYLITKGRIYNIRVEANLPFRYKTINLKDDSLTKELCTAMFGPYTIGGTDPDFINAAQAAYNLRKASTSGNVEFNFRPGLDTLFGIDQYRAPYEVLWQSESRQASDVRLLFSVCRECYRISFKHLTIHPLTNTSAMYNYKGAEFIGGQLSLDSCIIRGLNDPGFRNGITFVHTDSLSVTNCRFVNLEHGITLSAYQWYGSNHFTGNNYILNNTFDSVANGIHLLGRFTGDSTYLAGNTMHNPAVGVEFSPESFSYRFVMEKNKITGASTYALYAGETISFSVGEFYANNNMLGGAVVFYSFDNAPLNFNYNSIFGRTQMMDCRNVHMRNNSFYNTTATNVLTFWQSFNGTTVFDCDFNNYYSSGGGALAHLLIQSGSVFAYNIAAITAFTGSDMHSVSTNPLYISSVDLHSHSPVLDNAGTPISGIATDVDNELRSSVAPDIGCDEFMTPSAVHGLNREQFFDVHPNPAMQRALLTYNLLAASKVKIELADRVGRNLCELRNERQGAGNYQLSIDFETCSIAKGFYLLRMTVDNQVYVKKLVVE